ncbi:MAG TPA: VCBS repeat-containing protein, partial [Candidatus Deferrimicrobium sp.]|nr:VCBS repeat-containing protein [Candidatus Deferrimicrobium sp.]
SVFASDLDGDGDADLAVANDGSFNVSILTNNGDGTYQAAVNYGADDGLTSVFAADLDGDSDNDLAVANYWSNNVSILKNNGDGTYQATVNYGAGVRPRSVFAADLDGDGDNDLAVANEFSDNVSILINLSNVGPPELTQYYFIKDRLENLEIDLFPVTIPTAGYDLGAGNSFVDLSIRPGSASGQQLEAFSRLMMAMKLMNAGYRYVPTDTDPLLETEMVRGAEEMWDLGIKNTASAIVSAVGFIHLFDQIGVSVLGEKLYSKMLAKLVGFIVDAAKQVKRFIPSQEVRNWFDLLFPALKEAILNQLREDPCLMCIIVEPGVRLVGDEIAISGYHVPHTQGCISDAGLWASTNNYTGSHEAAEGAFQTCWNSIKVNTDASAQTVAQYEAQSGAPDAIAKTQEFLDSPFSGNPFVVIKKFLGVIGAIVNPAGVYYSVKAAGEAISTAATVPTDIHLGINNIFGQSTFSDLTPNKPEAFGSGVAVAAAVFRQSLPAELEIYNARAAGLAAAVQNGDSAAIFEAAESLYVAAENVSDLFHDQFNAFTSKSDSAWAQVPNFDSLLGRADSASIRANMRLGQSYLVAIGIQLNPYDSEFNAMSMTALDSSAIDLEQSWLVVDSVMQLLSAVTSVPTLVVIPEQDYFMVGRHSAFVVDYVITNIGDDTAIQVFSRASQVEGITIHGADSTPLMDIAPGDSVAMSYSISLDSVPEPSFYYQTSIFDVAAYASNGIGGLASILVTAQTRACGDIDGIAGPGGPVDVADLTYLIAYLFQGGAAPPILAAANVDGINGPGGPVDVADLTYLVAYLFQGGAAPVC